MPLSTLIASLPMAGRIARIAWGSTIRRSVSSGPMPREAAARVWLRLTERMPPRMTSPAERGLVEREAEDRRRHRGHDDADREAARRRGRRAGGARACPGSATRRATPPPTSTRYGDSRISATTQAEHEPSRHRGHEDPQREPHPLQQEGKVRYWRNASMPGARARPPARAGRASGRPRPGSASVGSIPFFWISAFWVPLSWSSVIASFTAGHQLLVALLHRHADLDIRPRK